MKKYDNFLKSINVLKKADFNLAKNDEIYRTGIVGQFNLTFELAWKAIQAVLQLHFVPSSESGSPREILKLAYMAGFIDDSETWLIMLKKRNISIHIYSEEDIDELIDLIRCSFIPAFDMLAKTLREKINEAEESSWNAEDGCNQV